LAKVLSVLDFKEGIEYLKNNSENQKEVLGNIRNLLDRKTKNVQGLSIDEKSLSRIYTSIEKICQNPYILSEQYHGDDSNDIISFNKIDNGILPSPDTGLTYLFDINSPKRFRALCVDTLKWTSEHSFLFGNLILNPKIPNL
jgi:hypothetical protein